MSNNQRDLSHLSAAEKRRMVAQLLAAKANKPKIVPQSVAQQRLWFLDQFEPGVPAYNMPEAYHLKGNLNVGALEQSINAIVKCHAALRTTFRSEDDQPVQVVLPTLTVPLERIDLTNLPATEREKQAQQWQAKILHQPFDLATGPLLRACLLQLAPDEHIFLLVIHHIVSDGWSMGIFFRELTHFYEATVAGKTPQLSALPVQYADFSEWQHAQLADDKLGNKLTYWHKQLANSAFALDLPTDYPRQAVQKSEGTRHFFTLSPQLSQAVQQTAQQERVTLFMLLLTTFKILLYRYTGQSDILVGTPIAGRTRSDIEALIGFFLNMLVLRTPIEGTETCRDLLQRVRKITLEAFENQEVPFEQILHDLNPDRDLSRPPLFQVMFALQNAPGGAFQLPGLLVRDLDVHTQTAKMDLSMFFYQWQGQLHGIIEYNTALFAEETIERLAGHYQQLLQSIIDNPNLPISELELLSKQGQQKMLQEWNDTQTTYPQYKGIHQLFESSVEENPSATAVVCGEKTLTYRELNNKANQLAHYLREQGVGPDVVVGLYTDRSTEMVVGLLGILKSGGAYLPLDPTFPQERIAFMLQDAQVQIILTQEHLLSTLPVGSTEKICLDKDTVWRNPELSGNFEHSGNCEHLAYLIYTSGSTGRPKGVRIPHRAVVNFLSAMVNQPRISARDVLLAVTTISFDISVLEIFGPLIVGATVILAKQEIAFDGFALLTLMRESQPTIMQATPATWQMLIESGWKVDSLDTRKLKKILCGGEALPTSLAKGLLMRADEVWNMFGPTETTVWSTIHRIESAENPIPIGRPIANTQIYILDKYLQPMPQGAIGDLFIGGDGVALGYHNRHDLTAQRFIKNPFSTNPKDRLYLTGDLARYRAGGLIDYLGRSDHQVKVRGFRIELGEIEAILRDHPLVKTAVVLAREDQPDDKRLVAYIVEKGEQTDAAQKELLTSFVGAGLRHFLGTKLPDYMIPSAFVLLDALPLTPNGKIDRKALPAPEGGRGNLAQSFVPPRNQTEELVAGLWQKVLNTERVGIFDNFFELGGHSLSAVRLVTRIHDTFAIEFPVRRVFELPTVAEQSKVIETATFSNRLAPIKAVPRPERLPLSFAQQRIWFLDQFEGDKSAAYNMAFSYRIEGALEVAVLRRSFEALVARHEILRTSFPTVAGQPIQVITPTQPIALPVLEMSPDEAKHFSMAEAYRPIDLTSGSLLRPTLLKVGTDTYILNIYCHHIIFDGWSTDIFFHELFALYEAFLVGQPSPVQPLPIQYADFALWQKQQMETGMLEGQRTYWQTHLTDAAFVLELPTDRPRPLTMTYTGQKHVQELPPSLSIALKRLAIQEDVTLYMLMLAGFETLLHRYTGQSGFLVGSPIAGRTRVEVEGLIGMFVNTLLLRADFTTGMSFRRLLTLVREDALTAFEHQDIPVEMLIEDMDVVRDTSRNPLFQVFFAVQNVPWQVHKISGLVINPIEEYLETAKLDLSLYIIEDDDTLRCVFEYNTDLFNADTIERMAGHYQMLLEAIVVNPDQSIATLPLLQTSERQQLEEWNVTATEFAIDYSISHHFEQQVASTPDAIAIFDAENALSYRVLNRRANQLARYLRGLGVSEESRVAVCLPRSAETVITLLAILKCGAAYVPLDPHYPTERLTFMLMDSKASVLVKSASVTFAMEGIETVLVEHVALERFSAENLAQTSISSAAYIIYTSGSTGRPKGVVGTHSGALNRFAWMWEAYPFAEGEICCHKTSLSFVDSIWEIFGPLLRGIPAILIADEVQKDPRQFVAVLAKHQVSRIVLVPSLLRTILDSHSELAHHLPKLRLWVTSGEALSADLAQRFAQQMPHARLINLYGSSEMAGDATYCDLSTYTWQDSVPIGQPIANMQVHVLDSNLQPLPVGIPGEIYVGGAGLALGYYNQPELTAERFIDDPFSAAKLYRSGDIGKWQPDGMIQYLGRVDHQVKVRGFRIELGEIEATLRQHSAVENVVAVVREEHVGDQRIIAYITPAEQNLVELRRILSQRLPEYMLPSLFMPLAQLPLTPNGKIDRLALPEPDVARPQLEDGFIAPQSSAEKLLARIWCELLKIEQIGLQDNFFELGGHSLLATQLTFTVQEYFRTEFPLRDFFMQPTIAGMIETLEQLWGDVKIVEAIAQTWEEFTQQGDV